MIKEQSEYLDEQAKVMNDQLKDKMKNFIQARHQENEVLEYVLQQEANSSDEEFNHFDEMASKMKPAEVSEKLKRNFINKIDKVQREIESE